VKKKDGVKLVGAIILMVLGVGLIWAQKAKAIIPPRALRLALFSQFYKSGSLDSIKIIKLTYSDSSRSTQNSNFENDQKVYVQIKIYDPNSGNKIKLTDRVFNLKPDTLANFKFTKAGAPPVALTPSISKDLKNQSAEITFTSLETAAGANYLDYEYVVSEAASTP